MSFPALRPDWVQSPISPQALEGYARDDSPNWTRCSTRKVWCETIPQPESKPVEHVVPNHITCHPNEGVDHAQCLTE